MAKNKDFASKDASESIFGDQKGGTEDTGEFPNVPVAEDKSDGSIVPTDQLQNTPDGPVKSDKAPEPGKSLDPEKGVDIVPSTNVVQVGGSGIGDRVPVEKNEFHGSVENTKVEPGKYREVSTGDTIQVTEVTNDYVSFHYLSRGVQTPMSLPVSQFKMVGRFVPHE